MHFKLKCNIYRCVLCLKCFALNSEIIFVFHIRKKYIKLHVET